MKKNFLFLIFGIIFLIGSFGILLGAEEVEFPMPIGEETIELGDFFGMEGSEISANNILMDKEGDFFKMTFPSTHETEYVASGDVKLKNNDLKNIVSKKGAESYLKIDSSGNMIEADLTIGGDGQVVYFPGENPDNSVRLGPGDRLIYKEGKVRVISSKGSWVDLSKWKSGELILEGNGFDYYKSNNYDKAKFNYGDLVRYDGKNFYFLEGDKVSYNGVDFNWNTENGNSNERLNLYTDGAAHSGEAAISFGEKNFVLSCGENPGIGEVIITGESTYYKNLLKNVEGINLRTKSVKGLEDTDFGSRLKGERILTMSLTSENSYIDFGGKSNILEPSIPTIFASNGYEIETGKLHIKSFEGKTEYLKSDGEMNGALDIMLLDNSNSVYDKALQIGENSNLLVNFKYKDSNWTSLGAGNRIAMLRVNQVNNQTVFYRAVGSKQLQEDFENIKNQLTEDSKILDDYLKKKYSGQDLSPFFEGKNTIENNGEPTAEALKYYLTTDEMKKALGSNYERFRTNIQTGADMTFYKPVLGTNEKGYTAQDLEFYGKRTHDSITGIEDFNAYWNEATKWVCGHNGYQCIAGTIGIKSQA